MPIKFYCPLGHRLSVPDHRAGKKGRCPTCHQKVIVPVADPRPSGKPKGEQRQAYNLEEAIEEELGLGLEDPNSIVDFVPTSSSPMAPASQPAATSAPSPPPSPAGELRPPPAPAPTVQPTSVAPTPPAAPYVPPAPQPSPAQQAAAAAISHAAPRPVPVPQPTAPQRSEATPQRIPRRDPRWIRPAEPETLEDGYAPDSARLQHVYLLAGALAGVTAFSLSPALQRMSNLPQAPGWVQVVALLAFVQVVYALWLVTLPDWSTTWIGMLVCAGCAAVYGAGMGIVLTTAPGRNVALGLTDVRNTAGGWCAVQILLLGFLAYGFGRASNHWQRALQPKPAGR